MENLIIVLSNSDETGVEICNFVNTVDGNHQGGGGGGGFQFYREFIPQAGRALTIPVHDEWLRSKPKQN